MNRPGRWWSSRRIRPPVMVSAPVSMIVTSQDSGGVAVAHNFARKRVDGKVRPALRVGTEVALDDVAEVSDGQDEPAIPEMVVGLHDVPEDRLSSDFDHRLRADDCLLSEACSKTTGENDYGHVSTRFRFDVAHSPA